MRPRSTGRSACHVCPGPPACPACPSRLSSPPHLSGFRPGSPDRAGESARTGECARPFPITSPHSRYDSLPSFQLFPVNQGAPRQALHGRREILYNRQPDETGGSVTICITPSLCYNFPGRNVRVPDRNPSGQESLNPCHSYPDNHIPIHLSPEGTGTDQGRGYHGAIRQSLGR